jgi:hypothetical protein
MGKGREYYELTAAGIESLKKFWRLSGYPPDSLTRTSEAKGSDFFKATGLAEVTFKKIARILDSVGAAPNDPIRAQPATFLKFARPLFLAVANRLALDSQEQRFQEVLEKEIIDPYFFKLDNQESSVKTISHPEIAELLNQLDYEVQIGNFQTTIASSMSRAIAFGLPTEDELIEKWLSRRLRNAVKHSNTSYNSNVEYAANGDWSIDEFCIQIKEQLKLEQPYGQKPKNQKPMGTTEVIDRLKAISTLRTVFMRISGLQQQEYSEFLEEFYQPLKSGTHNANSRIIVLLTQCSDCQDLLTDAGIDMLGAMDISKDEVGEWLPAVRGKIKLGTNTTIPDRVDDWSLVWDERDRQKRLEELLNTICASFGNASLRFRHLRTHLITAG